MLHKLCNKFCAKSIKPRVSLLISLLMQPKLLAYPLY